MKDFFQSLKAEHKEVVSMTPEGLQPAQTYIAENVVGQTSIDDRIHIATATLNKVDVLVSWNFKHVVNVYRIRDYNSVNLRLGYSQLDIRSPKAIVNSED